MSSRHPHNHKGSAGLTVALPLVSLLMAMNVFAVPPVGAAAAGVPSGTVPRVVVSILIDQLRSDYLDAFMPLYGQDGFVKLLREGRVYTQAEVPHYRPDRASAAATLVTGTTPSNHGIVGMGWLDEATLRPVFCVDDRAYAGVGTKDASAPTALDVSTLGDELKVATEGKAIVYAIAPTRDAAILTAGHAADGAIWIDDASGRWCSSSYYGAALPAWVSVLNGNAPASRIGGLTWKPSSDLVGNFSYFLSGGMKKPFAHRFKGDGRYVSFKTSGLVNEEVAAATARCLNGTMIGTDDVTDYLALTLYAGNLDHKTVSEAPMELQDTYVRLDESIGRIIREVEQKVGAGRALFVITSTGYADEETSNLSNYRIPTGTFDMERAVSLLNLYLTAVYGQGQYVDASYGTQLYLNERLIEQKQLNRTELLDRVQDFLLQLSGVKDVYTSVRLMQGAWTPGISRMRGAYNPHHSGDVMVEITPGWRYVNNAQHDTQLVRESYIPFPIIFFGQGCKADTVSTPVTIDYIAPTLSKAIRIRAPNACAAAPLF